jgi:hypothetical protein
MNAVAQATALNPGRKAVEIDPGRMPVTNGELPEMGGVCTQET